MNNRFSLEMHPGLIPFCEENSTMVTQNRQEYSIVKKSISVDTLRNTPGVSEDNRGVGTRLTPVVFRDIGCSNRWQCLTYMC